MGERSGSTRRASVLITPISTQYAEGPRLTRGQVDNRDIIIFWFLSVGDN
jgi:hypothetical protein